MRIDESSLIDQSSSTANRAAESQRIQVDSAASAAVTGAAAGDRVDLSGLAGRISQTMQALSNQSAQRAGQLRTDFQAGRYQPDVQRLASIMARA
jgi:hypothetical protein